MERDTADVPEHDRTEPKRRRKWPWVIGLLVLLGVCDDDDDGPRRYCYTFSSGERLCFAEPLPEGKYCYLGADKAVRCYDQPQ